jgi:hypothetical protein
LKHVRDDASSEIALAKSDESHDVLQKDVVWSQMVYELQEQIDVPVWTGNASVSGNSAHVCAHDVGTYFADVTGIGCGSAGLRPGKGDLQPPASPADDVRRD